MESSITDDDVENLIKLLDKYIAHNINSMEHNIAYQDDREIHTSDPESNSKIDLALRTAKSYIEIQWYG